MSERTPEQIALDVGKVFTPAVPVDDKDLFAGRIDEIRRVADAINQRGQHAMIFGDRGVGKTSLTNIISTKLTGNVPVIVPRITCTSADSFTELWRAVLSDIDFQIKKKEVGFLNNTLFMETKNAADVLGDKVTPDELRRLLTMLSQGKIVVVIFDEFDRIESTATRKAVADTIKTFSDHSVPVTIVIVGVAETADDLIAEHQSIERVLVQVKLPRMKPDDLIEILKKGTAKLHITITDDAARFIASLSQGLPYYTHLLALHAARTALDEGLKEIDFSHVSDSIDRATADSHASLRIDLQRAISSPQQANIFSQVLLACALTVGDEFGYFSAADVRPNLKRLRGKDFGIPSFARHLKSFCHATRGSVLEKIGTHHKMRYRFRNALMPPLVIMKGYTEQKITANDVQAIEIVE